MANNKKDYPRLADKIVDSIGGANNVSLCVTCFTRLRFNLVDDGLAQLDQLKKLDGVLGAQWSGGQLQVVIGPDVESFGTAGKAHEHGGRYRHERYPKRPFMGPALEKIKPRLPKLWAGSVR